MVLEEESAERSEFEDVRGVWVDDLVDHRHWDHRQSQNQDEKENPDQNPLLKELKGEKWGNTS